VRRAWGRSRRRVLLGLAAIVLLALTACAARTPTGRPVAVTGPPPGTALRVMTWNVETHAHGPDEWVDLVARMHPDVLALQEICAGEADQLAVLLQRDHGLAYRPLPGPIRPPTPAEAHAPVNAALGPACDTGPDDVAYGLAVLTRLPTTPPVVATFPPDHRDEQRGFMTLRVTTPAGPVVTVYTAHLGLDGAQDDQIRRLADDARRTSPTVVLGDLNIDPQEPELAPFRDGFTEVDPDAELATTVLGKIDYIFLRGLAPAGPPQAPATSASDHRPLFADLRLLP
jgi:endonuclease/exonuclease/phosphatase family metal-dependent hydrolase